MTAHDIDLATEIWAAAQKGPGEGIDDAIERIVQIIEADRKLRGEQAKVPSDAFIEKLAKQYDCHHSPGFKGFAQEVARAALAAQAAEIERLRGLLSGVLVYDLVPLLPDEYIAAVRAALSGEGK